MSRKCEFARLFPGVAMLGLMLPFLPGNGTQAGAAIAVNSAATPSSADLTGGGTGDWAQWSYVSNTVAVNRKATGGSLINATFQNNRGISAISGTTAFSWTDGTNPSSGSGVTGGLQIGQYGAGNAFKITAPAGTTARTLTVYLGARSDSNSSGTNTVTATLSDDTANPITSTFIGAGYNQKYLMYSFTYSAASEGQTLSIQLANGNGALYDYPAAELFAATLTAVPEPASLGLAGIGMGALLRRRRGACSL